MASEYGVISEARLLPRSRGSNTRDGLITTSTKDEFTKLLETLNNKILKGNNLQTTDKKQLKFNLCRL